VRQRAVKGVVVLTGRTFVLSFISLAATALLTVFLEPSHFGIFWIVSAVVNFLVYFSDVGLAAALIQAKEKPQESDLKTTFTIQILLVLVLLVTLAAFAPYIRKLYSLSPEGMMLLGSLAVSLIFSSLKTIPSVLMERELEFEKLVIPQVLETLVYSVVAVFLAWKGLGVTSFTLAVLARGLIGLITTYILKPWVPGFTFNRVAAKRLLTFGLPYQANSLLALIKDDGLTVTLGIILGPVGIGLLGWAQKWGYAPLRFFMDHVLKVTFPAFARMQEDPKSLERAVNRSIFFICFLVFPSLVGLLSIAPILIDIIPKYEKWQPALVPLFLIGISTIFAPITSQLTNLLTSIGRIKVTFILMIMWTVLTWILVPVLAIKYGVNGAAAGYAAVAPSSIVAIFLARKFVKFSLVDSALKPAIASAVMGIILFGIRKILPPTPLSLLVLVLSGIITYTISIYLLVGASLSSDIKRSLRTLFSR
ncbi:oligosaccharide flippase family protein, partial [Candidatus Woesebacteria bacterium]|nr:oligosaccharide flippase family protein [Candidatus Woesebacteria bacterium]